ncbi:hypothetical protein J6590_038050 [Homalodisca vitripennis]|nr:hypothetical protein J6590_038050 [Homalodisca vitripennis]
MSSFVTSIRPRDWKKPTASVDGSSQISIATAMKLLYCRCAVCASGLSGVCQAVTEAHAPALHDHYLFSCVREYCKREANSCGANYMAHLDSAIPKNNQVFWSFINDLKKESANLKVIRSDVKEATDPAVMCGVTLRQMSLIPFTTSTLILFWNILLFI